MRSPGEDSVGEQGARADTERGGSVWLGSRPQAGQPHARHAPSPEERTQQVAGRQAEYPALVLPSCVALSTELWSPVQITTTAGCPMGMVRVWGLPGVNALHKRTHYTCHASAGDCGWTTDKTI